MGVELTEAQVEDRTGGGDTRDKGEGEGEGAGVVRRGEREGDAIPFCKSPTETVCGCTIICGKGCCLCHSSIISNSFLCR